MPAHVVSVNRGRPRLVPRGNETARTAIWKEPVTGPVAARGVNLDGGDQADRTVLEVSAPRIRCYKLGLRFGDPRMQKRFAKALRTGAYLRIIEEGVLEAGEAIALGEAPGHGVTVRLIAEAVMHDHSPAPRLLAAPQLPDDVREWAQKRVAA